MGASISDINERLGADMSRNHSLKGIRIGRLGAAAIATAVLGIPAALGAGR